MSDQATTQPDPNTTQLATVEQQIASLSIHNIDEIGAQLGAIYDEAEARGDLATRDRAGWLWNAAQEQATAIQTARAAAATAATIAKTVTAQRDAAINEHAQLREAAEDFDIEHPVIGRLIEEVEDNAFEVIVSNFRVCTNEPGEDLINGIFDNMVGAGPDQTEALLAGEMCEAFVMMLFSPWPDKYSMELRRKVFDFIAEVHPRIKADLDQYVADYNARREADKIQWQRQTHDWDADITADDDDYGDVDE